MRKFIQKQLIELIQTVSDGIEYAISKSNTPEISQDILTDCYSGLSSIEEALINNTSKERFNQYHNYIIDIQENLEILNNSIFNSENIKSIHKYIKKEILILRNYLENEKIIFEVVFLPYKASMWDSMESVWSASYSDENCNAVVIPIPYFDRKPDGSFAQMNYEGDYFPEYVPITNWKQYDIKQKKPDVIYFHNPYDQYNFVTSVHPAFYSSKLKEYTNMLVYIPYFVFGDEVPESFCKNSGIYNANKVIVQSEKAKETFIDVFIKTMSKKNKYEKNVLKQQAIDKYIALGSPKIDAVLNYQKNKPDMPNSWKQFIINKIGKDKSLSDIKLILYNTHINEIINNGDNFLKKLKYVFSIFNKRNDVILIWRPHPLSEATAISMRPEHLTEYKNIIEQYKKDKIGIYDDSYNFHIALAVSDAYFGDGSSLVYLYSALDKPLLIQKPEISYDFNEESLHSIGFEDIVFDGNYGYFASTVYVNGLFKVDMTTKKAEFLGSFPDYKPYDFRLYGSIKKYKNKLFIAPISSNYFCIYDIEKKEFKNIPINDKYSSIEHLDIVKFFASVQYEKYIFFIGSCFPAIVQIDAETEEFSYYGEELFSYIKKNKKETDFFFNKDAVLIDDCIIISCSSLNIVAQFNVKTHKTEIFHIGDKNDGFTGLCFDGKNFWLTERNEKNIIKWNKQDNSIKKIPIINNDDNEEESTLKWGSINMFYDKKQYIWIFPGTLNNVIKIDINTDKIEYDNSFNSEKNYNLGVDWFSKYYFASIKDDIITAFYSDNNSYIQYNLSSKLKIESHITYPKDIYEKLKLRIKGYILQKSYPIKNIWGEFYDTLLEDFIDLIISNSLEIEHNDMKEIFSNFGEDAGSQIHNYIIKNI